MARLLHGLRCSSSSTVARLVVSPRLKQVISALYRPQAHRRVFALSRPEAESLPSLPGVAVISVTAPRMRLAKLREFQNVLRLSFADVDHLSPDISPRAKAKVADAFTLLQARQVIAFVEALAPDVHDLVVHCEGGYSRSCAIAKFLHERYAYAAELDRLHDANPSVVTILRQAIKR